MTERMTVAELKPFQHKQHCIGLDIGVECGAAVWSNVDKGWKVLRTMSFWETHDFIKGYAPGSTAVAIEIPKLFLYADRDKKEPQPVRDKKMTAIGAVVAKSVLMAERLENLGYVVKRITPTGAKWDAAELLRRTGIKDRTSKHVRDAVKLLVQEGVGDVMAARSARRTPPASPSASSPLSDLWE